MDAKDESTTKVEALQDDRDRIHAVFNDAPPFYRNPGLLKLYFLLIAPMLTSTAWGFDLGMTGGLQAVDGFMQHFGNPAGATLRFYGAAMSIGGIIATILGSPLIDRLGRRPVVFLGALAIVGMALMQTFSPSFRMFPSAKILLGIGANLQQIAGPVLVTELENLKDRSVCHNIAL